MQVRQIYANGDQRTFAVIMDSGDEAMEQVCRFAESQDIAGAQITGIGAFEKAVLRYFDWQASNNATSRSTSRSRSPRSSAISARTMKVGPRCTSTSSSAGAMAARWPGT
jgi:hypothetical protein